MIFCLHRKLSDIRDGYQYCLKCNKAFAAPIVCNHEWESIKEIKVNWEENPIGLVYVLQCKVCGILHNHHVSSDEGEFL